MKAYVIDQDELKQYIFIAIVALLLSFAFGYIVGDGQNADSQINPEKIIDSTTTNLSSPLEMKKNAKISADKVENKTVQKDLKKAKPENKKEIKKKPPQKNKTVAKKTSSQKPDSKPAITQNKKSTVQKKTADKDKKSEATKSKSKETAAKVASTDKQTNTQSQAANAIEQDQIENKRSYSIQAGMFASRNNAESFIEKLAVENFDAYVSDFVSTSGAVKYNVRVGRFEERNKAREKLKEYQKYFSTPAYVVISQ